MTGRKLAAAFSLLLATATPALSSAQGTAKPEEAYPTCGSRKVTDAESEAAHTKYLAGKVDYDEGKHDAAIQRFKQAYAKDCTKHELLVIISRSFEFKNDYPEAIRALETYLARVPTSPDAETHRARIETLKNKLAEQQRAAAAAASAAAGGAASSNAAAHEPPSPPAADAGRREHTIYPWLVVGAGVVTAAVGIVMIATVPANPSNCNPRTQKCSTCRGQPPPDDPSVDPLPCPEGQTIAKDSEEFKDSSSTAGRARDQGQIGGIVTGAGAALVVGGLLWHFLEPTGPRTGTSSAKTSPRVSPQVSPGYGGISLTGRF